MSKYYAILSILAQLLVVNGIMSQSIITICGIVNNDNIYFFDPEDFSIDTFYDYVMRPPAEYGFHDISMHPDGELYGLGDDSLERIVFRPDGLWEVERLVPYPVEFKQTSVSVPVGLCTDIRGNFYMSINNYNPDTAFIYAYHLDSGEYQRILTIPDFIVDDFDFFDGDLILPYRQVDTMFLRFNLETGVLDTFKKWEVGYFSCRAIANNATPCLTTEFINTSSYPGYTISDMRLKQRRFFMHPPRSYFYASSGATSTYSYYGSLPNMRIDSVVWTGEGCDTTVDMLVYHPKARRAGALYALDGGVFQDSSVFRDVGIGMHVIEVIDSLGCSAIDTFEIPDRQIDVGLVDVSVDTPYCGRNNGRISVDSVAGLRFSIDGQLWLQDLLVEDLDASSYTLYVANAWCKDSIELVVPRIDAPELHLRKRDSRCGGANGVVWYEIDGGTAPYTIGGGIVADTGSWQALVSGWYVYEGQDDRGCAFGDSIYVDSLPSVFIESVEILDTPNCGMADGRIGVKARGLGVRYGLDSTMYQQDSVISGLESGRYKIYAVDTNGCVDVQEVNVSEHNNLEVEVTVRDDRCGLREGRVDIEVKGGLVPYEYSLGAVRNSDGIFENLGAGVYVLEVKDSAGCMEIREVEIADDRTWEIGAVRYIDVYCEEGLGTVELEEVADGAEYGIIGLHEDLHGGRIVDLPSGKYKMWGSYGMCMDTVNINIPSDVVVIDSILDCGIMMRDTLIEVLEGGICDTIYYEIRQAGHFSFMIEGEIKADQGDTVRLRYALQAAAPVEIEWDDQLRIIEEGEGYIIFIVAGSAIYTYKVRDARACSQEGQIRVNLEESEVREPFIPNIFSPNGDGANDEWEVFLPEGMMLKEVQVYDRWGNRVSIWSGTGSYEWDGRWDSQDAPEGAYTYRVVYEEGGVDIVKWGTVTLVR